MNDERHDVVEGRIFLQPIAAPSILGLYGFAGATTMVAAFMAGWYGGGNTPAYLAPFAAAFGGLAQFLAGMWAFKARDGIATAMHGMWGSFWIAWGLLHFLFALNVLAAPTGAAPAIALWFFVLAAITIMGAFAAMAENAGLSLVLYTLAAGSAIAAFGKLFANDVLLIIAGYFLVVSAFFAWWTASSMMFMSVGKKFMPIGMAPGARKAPAVNIGRAESGVKHGQ